MILGAGSIVQASLLYPGSDRGGGREGKAVIVSGIVICLSGPLYGKRLNPAAALKQRLQIFNSQDIVGK